MTASRHRAAPARWAPGANPGGVVVAVVHDPTGIVIATTSLHRPPWRYGDHIRADWLTRVRSIDAVIVVGFDGDTGDPVDVEAWLP